MKYLKKFENHTAYEEARQNLILPNVSLCVNENEVHYNPIVPPETRVIAHFNTNENYLKIYHVNPDAGILGANNFNKVEVDGVEISIEAIDSNEGYLDPVQTGEHTVMYTLKNENTIGDGALIGCEKLISVIIPSNVIRINQVAFSACGSLISLTLQSEIPPTISRDILNYSNNCIIYVPAASVDTYKAASGWSTYASRIQAIPTT